MNKFNQNTKSTRLWGVQKFLEKGVCKGELCSLKSIKSVAQMIKKDVVKYDGSNKRWYA